MINWLRSLFVQAEPPEPKGPPVSIKKLDPTDEPIYGEAFWSDQDLVVESAQAQTVRLFEVSMPGHDQCLFTYRLQVQTDDLTSAVYPEMWCRVPGRGEFFSKGLHQKVQGTNNFASVEIPFRLAAGQRADLLKLNLVFEGPGIVRLRNIEVLLTPLRA